MTVELRRPTDDDWPAILHVANEAAPWAGEANDEWLANRRAFDRVRLGGAHYVAVDDGAIVGYGGIEGDGAGRCRVFVVMAPARLLDGTGDVVLDRLASDLAAAGANTAWMREEARDDALLAFAGSRGFAERGRFSVEGAEVVVLERSTSVSPAERALGGAGPTLLDSVMPDYDVHEVHDIVVKAPTDVVYAAAYELTVGEIWLLRPLMFLRTIPARLRGRPVALDGSRPVLDTFLWMGFTLLGERPGSEIAQGAIARYWSLAGNQPVAGIETAEQFASFADPGYAKAAMDLRFLPEGGHTRIVTETRVRSTSPDAKRSFGRYWFAIRWGSGAIRRSWLHAIKRRATRND